MLPAPTPMLLGAARNGPKIHELFSTTLYTGAGAGTLVNTGIDLTNHGGLVWFKSRSDAVDHMLVDTVRGGASALFAGSVSNPATNVPVVFGADGALTLSSANAFYSNSGSQCVAWTFRRAERFFDIIKYTGTSSAVRSIPHGLKCQPGLVIIKRISGSTSGSNWYVWHRSLLSGQYLLLNSTSLPNTNINYFPTPSDAASINVGAILNANGFEYIAYVFADDAETSGVMRCGYSAAPPTTQPHLVNIGWEAQYLLEKVDHTSSVSHPQWAAFDAKRGYGPNGGPYLQAGGLTTAESSVAIGDFTDDGFRLPTDVNRSYWYLAIRRPNPGRRFAISPAYDGKTVWDLDFDGPLSITTPGTYTLTPLKTFKASAKFWGAGGGTRSSTYSGGPGGFAGGDVPFEKDVAYTLYIGSSTTTRSGGLPGGGRGGTDSTWSRGGGGLTGIFIGPEADIPILLAPGGGGGGFGGAGGPGGGSTGGPGVAFSGTTVATGGTQTAGGQSVAGTLGTFLNGGWGTGQYSGGGGAGLYGGGGGQSHATSSGGGGGGGGSGFYDPETVEDGVLTSGSGTSPGNSSDPARGTAGNPAFPGLAWLA